MDHTCTDFVVAVANVDKGAGGLILRSNSGQIDVARFQIG